MNGACNVKVYLAPPLGPWGGVKGSNIIEFQLQSQFQRFLFQSLCENSQMKDTKHFRWDFLFCSLGYALGVRLGALRDQNQIPSCCPFFYLFLNDWTKFNQIWCVGYSHKWDVQRQNFFWPRPLKLCKGVKRSKIS